MPELYAVLTALILSTGSAGSFIDMAGPYGDERACKERLAEMHMRVFAGLGPYETLKEGCKTRKEWVKELGRDPWVGSKRNEVPA